MHRSTVVLALAALCACASRRPHPPPPADGPGAPGPTVRLPAGLFLAGQPTGPRNDVVTYQSVKELLLDQTEVTVAAYAACAAAGACRPAATAVEMDGLSDSERASASSYCNASRPDRADHPVNCVEWSQAKAYCAWAGKRLPAEEELEWAARNGKRGTRYPWGDDPPAARACWNGEGNDAGAGKRDGTCSVASHPAGDSAAGVNDLAGNVWEWTSTAGVILPDGRGRGGTPAKVARGGAWNDVAPYNLSASNRFLEVPGARRPDLGFRCAKKP